MKTFRVVVRVHQKGAGYKDATTTIKASSIQEAWEKVKELYETIMRLEKFLPVAQPIEEYAIIDFKELEN